MYKRQLCVGGELRQDADAGAPAPQELAGVPQAVSDGVVRGVPADRVRAPAPAEPAPPAPGAGEDAAVAKLVHLIVKFSKLLETSGRLSEREAAVVSGLAERRDTVVLAAYTVAATAQDAEYLADLVRGVAADFLSVKTEDPSSFDGPAEHDTAARLLHAIDEMFCRNLLDMDKCRYLQTLVLYKDPAVFAAFDVFADDEDVDELFDTLLHVAARDDGGDGGDGAATTRARGALRLAARDLRESLLIDPGDVEARRARVRLRRSIGDTLGAFDDARAAPVSYTHLTLPTILLV